MCVPRKENNEKGNELTPTNSREKVFAIHADSINRTKKRNMEKTYTFANLRHVT